MLSMFMERIDKFPDTTDAEKNDYRAQAKFLVAYYHFLLSRAYGPILLIKNAVDRYSCLRISHPGLTTSVWTGFATCLTKPPKTCCQAGHKEPVRIGHQHGQIGKGQNAALCRFAPVQRRHCRFR